MFNTQRWHRVLTVPALLVAIAVLVFSPHPLYALAMCPLMVVLPFQLHAAWRRDHAAVDRALTATRTTGYAGFAWGVIVALLVPPVGLIVLAAFVALLVLAGTGVDERRLAGVMMLEGLLIALVGVPMVWLGATYVLLVPAGVVLFAGGTWWLAEAARLPVTADAPADLPVAIAV